MRGIQTIDFDPNNVSATEIMSEVNITGVGPLTITALAAAPGVGRQLSMDNETASEVNDTITWTITGTDADGRAQQETITDIEDGGSANVSTKFYNTVSGIEIGGTFSTQITASNIGTNGVMVSKSILLDKYAINAPLLVQTLTGTMAWGIELTTQSLADENQFSNQGAVVWVDDADHTGLSASQQQNLADWPVAFLRVKTSSYTDTAELAVKVSQGW